MLMLRRILTAVPQSDWKSGKDRQDVLTPRGWPLWRTTYHTTTSAMEDAWILHNFAYFLFL